MSAFARTLFDRLSAIPIWLWAALATVIPAAILYASFPTCDYYWDGVLFSLGIESAPDVGIAPLLVPNHVLFNVFGFGVYWPLHQLSMAVRALPVLQCLDAAASLLSALLLFRLLYRLFEDIYAAVSLTAIFAFGATWWKYSVDADAYIISTLFILLAANRLLLQGARRLWLTGIWHCAAMLMHQLAVFFLPAVWTAILLDRGKNLRSRLVACTAYTGITGAFTLAVYYAAFRLPNSEPNYHAFGAWLTHHSGDSAFSFRPDYIVAGSFKSYLQLFFGGRIRNFIEFHNPVTVALAVLLVAAIAAFFAIVWRRRSDLTLVRKAVAGNAAGSRTLAICGAWFLSYAVFLLFWLPRNTFYKLLAWPALILLLGWILHIFRKQGGTVRFRTATFAGIILLWNFVLFTYPNSQAEANPLLVFAHSMQPHWSKGTIVYFQTFNTDDWLIRYTNPQTIWRPLDCVPAGCLAKLGSKQADFWLDTTALDFLERAGPHTSAWLSARQRELYKLEGNGRRVKFARLQPQPRWAPKSNGSANLPESPDLAGP